MRTHAMLLLLLLPMVISDVSDASFVLKLRKLIAPDPNDAKPKDPNPVGGTNTVNRDSPVSPVPQPQPQALPTVGNANDGQKNSVPPPNVPPPPKKDGDGGDKDQKQGKVENKGKLSHSTTTETCEGLNKCTDGGDLLACVLKTDPKYLVVLLQNKGDGIINVKLRNDFENIPGDIEVDKNKTEKINITRSSSESTQLTLYAGKEDCVLHLLHKPENNFFLRLPSYDKVLTPVNGAYFLILMVLMIGATWVCCAFRKKRQNEIPYQELEMALPESAAAAHMESAEGWDQDWDDDWDDNVAVKSPAALAASISANGLTSRSSNKDGWETNWDD
ncbi:uncharacterized protein LOC106759587 [Vigna radiata var. radiata]|uniref:Uncharacterized protein LOC106759587 n=1 Tax=Vigna radiata var. radiata TaxID=3916 RepID=A0A1S3TX25_VIGRR|nr:uncharacterized protein LOC106759587 [Vigna radiata var. radiata]